MTRSVTFSERPDVAALLAQVGKWTYDLSDYEISADGVGDRFAAYRQRFGL